MKRIASPGPLAPQMRTLGTSRIWEYPLVNGKSPFLMGKSTISMAIFNSYVSSPEGMEVS